jgi:hypothetical protein
MGLRVQLRKCFRDQFELSWVQKIMDFSRHCLSGRSSQVGSRSGRVGVICRVTSGITCRIRSLVACRVARGVTQSSNSTGNSTGNSTDDTNSTTPTANLTGPSAQAMAREVHYLLDPT